MFRGAITALITPFQEDKVDTKAFKELVEMQVAGGIHGLVPCGTTGECATLSHEEHNELIALCVKTVNKRVPVIAGTGSNSTAEAIYLSKHAEKVGADAVLVVTPYYNKPTQEGLYQHYKAIHDAINIPIILYNVPGRCAVDLSDETILRLAELRNIVGIKDATGNLERPARLRMHLDSDFSLLSGDDGTALGFNAQGGNGCISVTANLMPYACAQLQNLWRAGKLSDAQALQNRLMKLHTILFCESNPIPVKFAAHLMGLCTEEVRLPLVPPSDINKQKIWSVLREFGLV